jgi:hypothetical protein
MIWTLGGLGVTALMILSLWPERFKFGFLIWIFSGWFCPALVLAISGLRHGPVANQICGALVLVAIFIFLYSAL